MLESYQEIYLTMWSVYTLPRHTYLAEVMNQTINLDRLNTASDNWNTVCYNLVNISLSVHQADEVGCGVPLLKLPASSLDPLAALCSPEQRCIKFPNLRT